VGFERKEMPHSYFWECLSWIACQMYFSNYVLCSSWIRLAMSVLSTIIGVLNLIILYCT
jgi:hypothetical protein